MENNVIEKAEYLKETKNLIRQALQKQGADVSDTDPFRAFASIISSLKTGSGDDTIKVKTGEEIDNMTLEDTLVCICSNDYSYTDSDGVLVKYERGVIYEIVNGSVSKLLFDTNTTNYRELSDKPSINGVELDRNKSLTELGIQPKGDYALKKDLPRNTSELNNDSGFLTSFTEEDPTVPDYVKAITAEDIEKWNNKSDFDGSYSSLTGTPTIPTKTSELTNDSSFVNESYVMDAIENSQQGYATIDDLNNKVDKVVGKSLVSDSEIERLANITNYDDTEIKNILNSKADMSAIPTKVSQLTNDAGYLTEHQDISNLATKDELHFHDNKNVLDSITQENIDNWNNGTGGSAYELPIASSSTLGGIKVGANLSIESDGTLNASGSGEGSINIDALPIGSVLLYDGENIPEGYEEVGDYVPTYSTKETKVGTWIDGKTIYRRVVEFNFSSTLNNWNLVVSQTFTSLLKCCGFFKDGTIFMNFPVTNGNEILAVYGNGKTGVYEKHNYSYPNNKTGFLIIEYTKTTDEVVKLDETN